MLLFQDLKFHCAFYLAAFLDCFLVGCFSRVLAAHWFALNVRTCWFPCVLRTAHRQWRLIEPPSYICKNDICVWLLFWRRPWRLLEPPSFVYMCMQWRLLGPPLYMYSTFIFRMPWRPLELVAFTVFWLHWRTQGWAAKPSETELVSNTLKATACKATDKVQHEGRTLEGGQIILGKRPGIITAAVEADSTF